MAPDAPVIVKTYHSLNTDGEVRLKNRFCTSILSFNSLNAGGEVGLPTGAGE